MWARVSQINGCGICVDMHSHDLKVAGIFSVVAWREVPYITERAALALAEETRLGPEEVSDAVWEWPRSRFDERTLAAALVVAIATINAWTGCGW